MLHQRRQIVEAFPQGRQTQGIPGEPIVQVGSKPPGRDFRGQIAIGGGDDAHVHLHGARAADRLELLVLNEAQQFALLLERQFTDFVQEERAAVGEFHPAAA